MDIRYMAVGAVALLTSACATTTQSPIDSNTLQDSLRLTDVEVAFAEDRSVPNAYDVAVAKLVDGTGDTILDREKFLAYVTDNGGRGTEDDQLAERYLEYRIAEEVGARLRGNLTGDRDVAVKLDVEKVITPNAATMLLVGEVKGIEYDFKVIDTVSNDVLVELTKPSNPFVERSSVVGGGGGLLGLAARSGSDTNLNDLEQMVFAVAEEVGQIMTGTEVNKTVAKKIKSNL